MRRPTLVLGTSLLLGAPLAAATLACSCGPSDPPPTMETCSDATAATVTRAVPTTTPDRDSTPLADGDPIPSYFGAQGGQHVQIALQLEGSGFGTCIAQRSELSTEEGTLLGRSDSNVPLVVDGDGVRTSTILLFVDYVPAGAILRVEVGDQRVERRLGSLPPADAGIDASAL
jgi:hypothetical protein